jgi:signal transduction histidine kinase
MKANRASPVLLFGFGLLIGLILLTGLGALQRAKGTYRDVTALNGRYQRTEQALNAIGTGMQIAGLLARDYLLDPSNVHAVQHRTQLAAERAAMEREFKQLDEAMPVQNRVTLDRMRKEVEGYWDAMDPLFEWTPEEKLAQSWGFLRRQILPRREAALTIAREISQLAQVNLDRQRQEIDRRQKAMAAFIKRMLWITMSLGLLIAGITVFRMSKLESKSQEQRVRAEAAEQELRRLSRQLVKAQEEERKSISRELHDEVGQMLTALRMELRSVRDLRDAPEADFNEHVDSAKHLAEQSLRALKDMAMGLRPSMLDDLGLGSAIQWQARQFSKHSGIPVNVEIEGLPSSLPEKYRTCVYRLVQEALTNCARHSSANTIDVRVIERDGQLQVSVKDDGVGFNPETVRGRGLGLIGIEERVMELGGRLSLVSRPRTGTTVSARIPVSEEAARNVSAHLARG